MLAAARPHVRSRPQALSNTRRRRAPEEFIWRAERERVQNTKALGQTASVHRAAGRRFAVKTHENAVVRAGCGRRCAGTSVWASAGRSWPCSLRPRWPRPIGARKRRVVVRSGQPCSSSHRRSPLGADTDVDAGVARIVVPDGSHWRGRSTPCMGRLGSPLGRHGSAFVASGVAFGRLERRESRTRENGAKVAVCARVVSKIAPDPVN